MFEAYIIHILIIALIFVILTVSLNLAMGYTGLINLGHIAMYGVGAYTSALLVMNDVPFLWAMLAAGILASLFGLALSAITNKLHGDYLALATLGFTYIVYSILINWTSLTRGALGIPGIPKFELFGMVLTDMYSQFFFVLVITIISVAVMWKLIKSPYGRLYEAVRDDELGTEVLGKNTFRLKYQSMMVSSFFAGIAGSLYAHYILYIDPKSFLLTELVLLLFMLIIGGLASIKGSIIGVIITTFLTETIRFVPRPSQYIGPLREIIFLSILIAILIFRPRGILGKVDLKAT